MVMIPHQPPSRIPLVPVMVMHNNDEVSYDAFHSAFTCMQGDLPERNALCLLAGREHYETFATAEKMVTACEGDKLAKMANLNIKIMKQVDFGMVVKQAWEMQAAVLTAVQHKLLSWHYQHCHLPFNQLLSLAQEGRVPKHLW